MPAWTRYEGKKISKKWNKFQNYGNNCLHRESRVSIIEYNIKITKNGKIMTEPTLSNRDYLNFMRKKRKQINEFSTKISKTEGS